MSIAAVLVKTDQVRIFRYRLCSDDEEDQLTVDHFVYSDYLRGVAPRPMSPSSLYVAQFGGPDMKHHYDLLALPKECGSELYILHMEQVLVPEGSVWTAGPMAIWWHPRKVHQLPVQRAEEQPTFDGGPAGFAYFHSPTCGPIRVTER
jgi:hypothetical protein